MEYEFPWQAEPCDCPSCGNPSYRVVNRPGDAGLCDDCEDRLKAAGLSLLAQACALTRGQLERALRRADDPGNPEDVGRTTDTDGGDHGG